MNYTEMLNQLIDNSGKMLKDIAQECQQSGVNLTNTYLSGLKTTPGKVASDEISVAIARACNAKYENILVVQAYLDRAPAPILNYIECTKMSQDMASGFFLTKSENTEIVNEVQRLSEMTLAEYICEYISLYDDKPTLDTFKKVLQGQQNNEPKCMVIYPEQLKDVKLVSVSELEKVLKK